MGKSKISFHLDLTRLVGCRTKATWPIFKNEMLIYESEASLGWKILSGEITHLLDPRIKENVIYERMRKYLFYHCFIVARPKHPIRKHPGTTAKDYVPGLSRLSQGCVLCDQAASFVCCDQVNIGYFQESLCNLTEYDIMDDYGCQTLLLLKQSFSIIVRHATVKMSGET